MLEGKAAQWRLRVEGTVKPPTSHKAIEKTGPRRHQRLKKVMLYEETWEFIIYLRHSCVSSLSFLTVKYSRFLNANAKTKDITWPSIFLGEISQKYKLTVQI